MSDEDLKMKALLQVSTHLYQHLRRSGVIEVAPAAAGFVKMAGKAGQSADVTAGLRIMAEAVQDYHQVREHEQTRRQEIAAQSTIRITEIENTRLMLMTYLERSFDERRSNFERFFQVLDRGQSKGDLGEMQVALSGILELAKSSPFRDIQEFREKMNDSTFVLDL